MISLIQIELIKIFKKWRSYLGYLGITAIVALVQINLYFNGENYVKHLTRNLSQNFIITGNILNGYLIALTILTPLYILFPLTIVLVAGEILAGEATSGTYRLILTRPVNRTQIIISKFIAGSIYTFTILFWMLVVSLGVSLVIFGSGELFVFDNGISIFAENDVIWRFCLASVHLFISMSLVFSLTFLFSAVVENAVGPIIGSMSILIVFAIVSQLPFDFISTIKPYIFTNYIADWKLFFSYDIKWKQLIDSVIILNSHTIFFFFVTLFIFNKKDILS